MQVEFDRYVRAGADAHVDLATGKRVRVIVRAVPDEDWRRRWRVRIDALLRPPSGIEPLVDAGEAGPHSVFEVDAAGEVRRGEHVAHEVEAIAHAIEWLESRNLCVGARRDARVGATGMLRCDAALAWPIETAAERRAAACEFRAWRKWLRSLADAQSPCVSESDHRRIRRCDAAAVADDYGEALEEFDTRAGLVAAGLTPSEALRYARRSGRVAMSSGVRPAGLPEDLLAQRSFIVIGSNAMAWAAALARHSGRRHYIVRTRARSMHVHEEPADYIVSPQARSTLSGPLDPAAPRARRLVVHATRLLSQHRLAAADRAARRAFVLAADRGATRAEAALVAARALRWACRPGEAAAVIERALGDGTTTCELLVEAAEAATDAALLERGEAYARAALEAARDGPSALRAQQALDRARVWRGETASAEPWRGRAAWHVWGDAHAWPPRGAYPHAPCGALARWEWRCDRLERALWQGHVAAARRLARVFLDRHRATSPPLIRARAAWLTAHVAAGGRPDPAAIRRIGALGILRTGKARTDMEMLDQLSSLLETCQNGDNLAALGAAAHETRQLLRATSLAVFVSGRALPIAGDGRAWNSPCALAERCAEVPRSAAPECDGPWRRAAATIRSGGQAIGAIVATWPADAEVDARRCRMLLDAAALALSPVVRAEAASAAGPADDDMPEMIGVSPAMTALRDTIRRVARVPFAVLIHGESGAGKELVARAVHRLSPRASRPFRALNCAAMAEELVEAELFGRAQGAYTGATTARAGLFEDADRGTIFLDEVSELSPRAQAKLLRVLQEGEVRRVGETAARRADVRVIAASNVALSDAVEAHAFRADLLFRLDVLRILVPPLRDRPEDIPLLSAHFWREAAARAGTSAVLSPEVVGCLSAWPWPGNVRELQNAIAALAVAAPSRGRVGVAQLPPNLRAGEGKRPTLVEARVAFERNMVSAALARAGGRPGRAAAELGVSRQGLTKLMRRLKLSA